MKTNTATILRNSTPTPDSISYALEKETLTDGSHVYNVTLGMYRIGCCSALDARKLYQLLEDSSFIDAIR